MALPGPASGSSAPPNAAETDAFVDLAPLDGALALSMRLPAGSRPAQPSELDLSAAPGASLDVQQAWSFGSGGRVEVGCVAASAARSVPGLEPAILDAASAAARKAGGWATLTPERLAFGPLTVEQSFRAHTTAETSPPDVFGRHVLGFAGEPPQVVLCTVACAEQAAERPGVCQVSVATLRIEGFVEPPPAGWLSRAVGWASLHPLQATGAIVLVVLVAAALMLRFRPKPRW